MASTEPNFDNYAIIYSAYQSAAGTANFSIHRAIKLWNSFATCNHCYRQPAYFQKEA